MAKQIEGVSERILACAKQEFPEKGYTDASLRSIAAAAGTSTNSIYTAIVGPSGSGKTTLCKHEELIQQPGLYADFVGGRQQAAGWKL